MLVLCSRMRGACCKLHVQNLKEKLKTPFEIEDGFTPDISEFRCAFFQPIDFEKDHHSFPNTDILLPGRFMGITEDQGDPVIFQVLDQNYSRY